MAGVFLPLLNKLLLGAGTAGSHFRIPDTHSGLGEAPPEGEGSLQSSGRWPLPGEDQDRILSAPGAPLTATCLLCDAGRVQDIF